MLEAERRQPGNIVGQDLVSLGPELIERRIHVNGVPEHDEVDDESERTKLVLLSLAIALAQFAALAVALYLTCRQERFAAHNLWT